MNITFIDQCTNLLNWTICEKPSVSQDNIQSLSHLLPILFIVAFVYVIFTRNPSGAIFTLLPFWIIAYTHPIRQYNFIVSESDHIVFQYFFHVWGSYALGIIVGIIVTLSLKLPLLYDDKIINPSRRYLLKPSESFNNAILLSHFDLQYVTLLVSFVGVFFGTKLVKGDYVREEECFGFLSHQQSEIWGWFFIVVFSFLVISTFFWTLFRKNNMHSNRSNVKYAIPLFFFYFSSLIFMYKVVIVKYDNNDQMLWLGLLYVPILLLSFLSLYFYIGYIAMGLLIFNKRELVETELNYNKPIAIYPM